MIGCLEFDIDLFAARLCESMEKAKASSVYLAAFLGVAPHTIVAWRMGRSTPNAERLYYISHALKVPVAYLLGLSNNIGVDTPFVKRESKKIGGQNMISFSNDELRAMETLEGTHVLCNRCGEMHELLYGKKQLECGSYERSTMLAYVKCKGHTYIVGINGKKVVLGNGNSDRKEKDTEGLDK